MMLRPKRRFGNEQSAIALVFSSESNIAIFLALALATSLLYMMLLPSLPSGGLIPGAIKFITPLQLVFSIVFGILLSLVVLLNVQSFRMNAPSARGSAAGAVIASLVNGLCCTPLIPLLIAATGASTPVLFQYSPPIQFFFEHYATYFYLLSSVLLVVSIHTTSKGIACCRRPDGNAKM